MSFRCTTLYFDICIRYGVLTLTYITPFTQLVLTSLPSLIITTILLSISMNLLVYFMLFLFYIPDMSKITVSDFIR